MLYTKFTVVLLARVVCRDTQKELVEAREFKTTSFTSWGYSEADIQNNNKQLQVELQSNAGHQFIQKLNQNDSIATARLKDKNWFVDCCLIEIKPVRNI